RAPLGFLENAASHTLELFPFLGRVRVLRQWGGLCDMPPDFAPIIGPVEGLDGFILDVGWGTYGFKAGPAAGFRVAELIATGQVPEVIRPFALSRFAAGRLLGEKGAAAVSHGEQAGAPWRQVSTLRVGLRQSGRSSSIGRSSPGKLETCRHGPTGELLLRQGRGLAIPFDDSGPGRGSTSL